MKCERCGNSDDRLFGVRNGDLYCRKCLNFTGKEAKSDFEVRPASLELSYELSKEQARISKELIENFKNGKDSLVYAVTGSGKTEIIYQSIEFCLSKGLRVGFAVPRVDIVIELKPRFAEAFKTARIVTVYGEHAICLNGDIVILTTHQLYRYPKYFDLLILDEIDAFPYNGNEALEHFFLGAVRGNFILMSATPSAKVRKEISEKGGKVFELMSRYHGSPLPVPTYIRRSFFPRFQVLRLLNTFLQENKPVLVFAPTIELTEKLGNFLTTYLEGGGVVSSRSPDRKEVIQRFKSGIYKYLVTTTVLERGVTVKDLQVIVFEADHQVFSEESLVQIAGRVGRKIKATKGEAIFIGERENDSIRNAIKTIKRCNTLAGL